MGKLDSSHGTLLSYKAADRYKSLGMGVSPDTAIIRTDAPFGAYRSGFNHDQPRTAHGTTAQMYKMPVGG
jgi:hypothetical protein